jgi:hypothetical protein
MLNEPALTSFALWGLRSRVGSATELFAANAKVKREGPNGVLLRRGPWYTRRSYHRHRLVARVGVQRRRPRWPFSRRFALRRASVGDEAAPRWSGRAVPRAGRCVPDPLLELRDLHRAWPAVGSAAGAEQGGAGRGDEEVDIGEPPDGLSARTVNGVFGPCIERGGGGIPKGAGFRFADAMSVTISMRKHLFAALARLAGSFSARTIAAG